jgi:choline dehydrogenase-like flavoprotein
MDDDRVVVVGSGPTGVIAALTLVEAGVSVVMLESGDDFPRRLHARFRDVDLFRPIPPQVREPTAGVDFLTPDEGGTRWVMAHRLGGLSNHWSGIVLRYAEDDFTDGARLDEKFRWPISYADLAPYYDRVETLIGVRGGRRSYPALPASRLAFERTVPAEWQGVAAACEAIGRALAVLPDVHGPSTVLSMGGGPQNIAVRLLARLRRSPRFRLIAGAHVTRVLLDRDGNRASAVEYRDAATSAHERLPAAAVVVAAGAISTTAILLRSRSTSHPDGLGNANGLLGRYLHDHPMEYSQVETDLRFGLLDDRRKGGLYVTRQGYAGARPLQAGAFLLYGGSYLRLSTQLFLLRHRRYLDMAKGILTARGAAAAAEPMPWNASLVYVCWFGTQIPRPDNQVSLEAERTDRFGLPLVKISIGLSEAEREAMGASRDVVPELLAAAGAKAVRIAADPQPFGASVHYGGTVRMHASPRHGVLDQWNRMHGVGNLLVVDPSCFTTCVEKNPTLTAMAIAMRAAEGLARERRA